MKIEKIKKNIRSNTKWHNRAIKLKFISKATSLTSFFRRIKIVLSISLKPGSEKVITKEVRKKRKVEKEFEEQLSFLTTYSENDKQVEGLVSAHAPSSIQQKLVKKAEEHGVSLKSISSFRSLLSLRSRMRQLSDSPLVEWFLEDKEMGDKLIDNFGIRRPYKSPIYALEDIPIKEGSVIKPINSHGSNGVYLVHTLSEIFDVKKSKFYTSVEGLKSSMKNNLKSEKVLTDEWVFEELVYDNKEGKVPARDLKFFVFYGEVEIIQEITRFPEKRVIFWSKDGEKIRTREVNDDKEFKGQGVPDDLMEDVISISKKIPTPFLRIDFLIGENGYYFGEFTPRPGHYDKFLPSYDRRLGDSYLLAEQKLLLDLLKGKDFSEFKKIYNLKGNKD